MASYSLRLATILVPSLFGAVVAAACGGSDTSSFGTNGGGGNATGSTTTSTTTGGTGSTATGTGGSGGIADPPCTTDADCVGDPGGSVCDTSTGDCVACLPSNNACAVGEYCDAATHTCVTGCDDASDCAGGDGLFCDPITHLCVGCLIDTDCPAGTVCVQDSCVPGCSPQQGCQPGLSCCGSVCFDLAVDPAHCGTCNIACPVPPNAEAVCNNGICGMGACDAAYADCDGDSMTGCEWNILQDGPCVCAPGATQPCYSGAPGTDGVGPCHGGTQTCDPSGTSWGACTGQLLPSAEICANQVDEDCDGIVDNAADADGDGWTTCNGDCCDVAGPGCASPKLVNPGAFEVLNNGVDDDCDPASSDSVPVAACSAAQKLTGVTANDAAQAIDICQTTTANPPLPQKKWGLITASQLLANGTVPSATALADMQNKQTAILVNYGTGGIVPKKGSTMAGISSGTMRDAGDAGYVGTSTALTTTSQPPAAYLAAHGNALPASQGCSGNCPAGSGANDSVNIRLSIRVPTNAQSFSYDFRFVSAEYWSWQCTVYNDFYLALLQTGAPGIPLDKNISFDALSNPVSVNNGFFDVCVVKGCNTCPLGTGPLAGTGMEVSGGATNWLTTDAPILPGETMQLELMVFDVSDHVLDSLALLDNFRWNLQTSLVGTHE